MSTRTMLFLLLLVLALFLAVRFDVPTQVKMGVINLIYGVEIRSIKEFHVDVETLIPELEKEGLTRGKLRQELSAMLEKSGIRSLGDAEWQKTPGRPFFNIAVIATKTGEDRYQYSFTIDVGKSEGQGFGAYPEKMKTLWFSSGIGEGGVSEIRARIMEKAQFFLKIHSGA